MHRFDNFDSGRVLIGVGRPHDASVDAIVHRVDGPDEADLWAKAGPDYADARGCLGPIRDLEPTVTEGFDLAARFIIHTRLSGSETAEALEALYERCLRAAFDRGAFSVALPTLGARGAVPVHALTATVAAFLENHPAMERVILCCEDEGLSALFLAVANEYF